MNKNRTFRNYIPAAAVLAAFLLTILLLAAGSFRMEHTLSREQTELLQNALNQAVINCYAVEGRYPESLDYLSENYGVVIDTEKYLVTYKIFADNIKPEIQVIRINE